MDLGALDIFDYDGTYAAFAEAGLRMVQDPAQHARAASICGWEPRIRGLTPETLVTDALPPAADVEARFGWPVLIKGDRQTSRHRAELSIARNASSGCPATRAAGGVDVPFLVVDVAQTAAGDRP